MYDRRIFRSPRPGIGKIFILKMLPFSHSSRAGSRGIVASTIWRKISRARAFSSISASIQVLPTSSESPEIEASAGSGNR